MCSRDRLPPSYDAATSLGRSICIEMKDVLDKFGEDQDSIIASLHESEDKLLLCKTVVDLDAGHMVCESHFEQLAQKVNEITALLSEVRPVRLAPAIAHSVPDDSISVRRAYEWIKFTIAITEFEVEILTNITGYDRQLLALRVGIIRQWYDGSLPHGTVPDHSRVAEQEIETKKNTAKLQAEQKLVAAGTRYGFPIISITNTRDGLPNQENNEQGDEEDLGA